jgi:hypothetical protein
MFKSICLATALVATLTSAPDNEALEDLVRMLQHSESKYVNTTSIDLPTKLDEEDIAPLPVKWKPRRAICRMYRNPVYPTTYPWGIFYAYQNGPADDVHISGFMHQMPNSPAKHGFAITKDRIKWKEDKESCDRSRTHWNPTGENHGQMNMTPSHHGDLWPFITNPGGSGWYYQHPQKPTMYGWWRI